MHPATNHFRIERNAMHMKSSHHIHLEMIERTLQPAACFQLQAARHKALVIRDALTDDKEYCDALLLKIEHLLGEAVVASANPSATSDGGTPAAVERTRDAA
jgi:hypothetical protein